MPLILASGSRARASILKAAGLQFQVHPSSVDETELKRVALETSLSVAETALRLAMAKAADVAEQNSTDIVLAADQMLAVGDQLLDKPSTMKAAAATLRTLQGRDHQLINGVVLVQGEWELWRFSNEVTLSMRALTDVEISAYLEAAGERVLSSVGAYEIEGLGGQLLTKIEGDGFSVMGLPLFPLMDQLRSLSREGILEPSIGLL